MLLSTALSRFVPYQVRDRGQTIYRSGAVTVAFGDAYVVEAQVRGSRLYEVTLQREGNDLQVQCECPYFASDGACKHVWAAILQASERGNLLGNRGTAPMRLLESFDEPTLRSASSLQPEPTKPWERLLSQVRTEQTPSLDEDWKGEREIFYVIDVPRTYEGAGLYLEVPFRERKRDGGWGKVKTVNFQRRTLENLADPADREIIATLAGSPHPYEYEYRSVGFVFRMDGPLVDLLLPKICATGRCRLRVNTMESFEQLAPLVWDAGPPWKLKLEVEQRAKVFVIRGQLERDGVRVDVRLPSIFFGNFVIFEDKVAHFEDQGAAAWVRVLRREGKIEVPVDQAGEFTGRLLEMSHVPEAEWPEQLRYSIVTAKPQPHLTLEAPDPNLQRRGVQAEVSFNYRGTRIKAFDGGSGVYDPATREALKRDADFENEAVRVLESLGARSVQRAIFEIPPARLAPILRTLTDAGWQVESAGKAVRKAKDVHAAVTSGIDWFELHASVDFGSSTAALPELLKAIRHGEGLVPLADGTLGLIPDELLDRYGMLLGMGRAEGNHVRFSRAQAGLLDVLLAAREDVTFDAAFQRARDELRNFDRIATAEQPPGFVGELRGYQREGVAWMQFLQRLGFGGCLADDMGVGKTPQVLALLEARRELRASGQDIPPSLVIVPRSLIYNWMLEAARFTPKLRVRDHSGIGRSRSLQTLAQNDVILTTYGTLRRDVVDFQEMRFDYAILDEAQAIKNGASESAKAARLLRADHRLAMSGTPIENHLGELRSLFEFLNPGMLGSLSSGSFTAKAMRNPDEETRELLSRVVRPFILRRTKEQVARELPPKVEQTIYCKLEPAQRKQYDELRDHYRRAVLGRVAADGLAKSKMHILEALLRLRQAACHPGLLDETRIDDPSAKLDMLLPQLSEVTAEGHKALVFSQFTSLLKIVRKRLDDDNVTYEYLDGRTRDRQAHVERFQTDPECKLFLISLKAGGVGLNLTAAGYVFLLDPWWNPAVEAQAIDRTHRIGQKNNVFAYRLIAKDTVEEKVLELQSHKRNLADAIIRADNNLVSDLKREDLEFLLS